MSTRAQGSKWTTTEPQSVTFVELFFDLVFVYAVTQITGLLRHDLTFTGAGRAVLVLWLVWWAWTQFTWTLNPADTTHPAVRLLTLAATGAAFFMAQAIPDAFADGGAWFAIAYIVVRLLGLGIQLEANLGTPYLADARRWFALSTIGLAVVVAGGTLDSPGREIAWSLVVLADVLSALRAGRGRWSLHAEHFAERHGLIIIIALGESLIAAGVGIADARRDGVFAAGVVAAVLLVSAAWWIYFAGSLDRFREALEATPEKARGAKARDLYSFAHLPVVGGIIAIAVPIEEVLAHPAEHLEAAALAALVAGIALYVGGLEWARLRAGGPTRALASLLLVAAVTAVAAATASRSGLVTLAAAAGVLGLYALATHPRRSAD